MDEDLGALTKEQLIAEAKRLYRAMLDRELADAPRRDAGFSDASQKQEEPREDPGDTGASEQSAL